MKYLVMFLGLCLGAGTVSAEGIDYQRRIEEEQARNLPSCEAFVQQADICRKLREARELVRRVPLEIFERTEHRLDKNGKPVLGKRLVRREFALVAYEPEAKQFHTIVLDMPLVGDDAFQPNVQTEHVPPYQVVRIKGQTFNKMIFQVTMGGRELAVYAGKHVQNQKKRNRVSACMMLTKLKAVLK